MEKLQRHTFDIICVWKFEANLCLKSTGSPITSSYFIYHYIEDAKYLKELGLIASDFLKTFRDFGIRRKLTFSLLTLVNLWLKNAPFRR